MEALAIWKANSGTFAPREEVALLHGGTRTLTDCLREAVANLRTDPSRADLLYLSLQSYGRVNRFLGRFAEDEQAQPQARRALRADMPNARATRGRGLKPWGRLRRRTTCVALAGLGRSDEAAAFVQQAVQTNASLKRKPTYTSVLEKAATRLGHDGHLPR